MALFKQSLLQSGTFFYYKVYQFITDITVLLFQISTSTVQYLLAALRLQ